MMARAAGNRAQPATPAEGVAIERHFMNAAAREPLNIQAESSTRRRGAERADQYREALDPANPNRAADAARVTLSHLEMCAAGTASERYAVIQLIPQEMEIQARRDPASCSQAIRKLRDEEPDVASANFTLIFHQEKQMTLELGLLLRRIMEEGTNPEIRDHTLALTQAMLETIDMYHRVHMYPANGRFAMNTARMWLARNGFTQGNVSEMTRQEARTRTEALASTLRESAARREAETGFPAHAVAYFDTKRELFKGAAPNADHQLCSETAAMHITEEMTKLAYIMFLPTALTELRPTPSDHDCQREPS